MYEELVNKTRKEVSKVTLENQKHLLKLYSDSIDELAKKIPKHELAIRQQNAMLRQLQHSKAKLQKEINESIKNATNKAAVLGTEPEQTVMAKVFDEAGIKVSKKFEDMFATVHQNIANDILSGELYKDSRTLSDRIWGSVNDYGNDIQDIVVKGIQQKKSAKELAKDLKAYVKPPANRGEQWAKDFPQLAAKDAAYKSMRLARTSINHSYQTATIQSSQINPFVEGIRWFSQMQHGRVCDLCIARATVDYFGLGEGVFPKDEVPLDHPNGMCTMVPVILDKLEDIGKELNEWIKGADNPKLDEWYENHGESFGGLGKADTSIISNKIDKVNEKLSLYNIKNYDGVWKNPVTVKDYNSVKGSIGAKVDYYDNKMAGYTVGSTDYQKYESLKDLVLQYQVDGENYLDIQKELEDLNKQLKLALGIKEDDRYTQERKDKAYWFTDKKEADKILRPQTSDNWKNMTMAERKAAYEYTSGSGKFNRPLRGYEHTWNNFKGVGNVSLNAEGGEKDILALHEGMKKSTYDFDIWLNRGVEDSGFSKFVQLTKSELGKDEDYLKQKLIGKVVNDDAFFSTGAAKGAGFSGNIINVYAPKGTKMIYAEPFSHYGQGTKNPKWDGDKKQTNFGHEFEVILDKGYKYKITKVEKKYGKVFIDVDVIFD